MIWIIFGALTAAVIAALIWPVLRPKAQAAERAEFERAVFRDQLAELERDCARGAIGPAEAEAAKNEIVRRLLNAGGAQETAPSASPRGRAAGLAVCAALPLLALPLYLAAGAPDSPDVPLEARLARAEATGDFPAQVAKVEAHLARSPNDVEGWRVLAPAYRRMERYDDAARAYGRLLALTAPSAELYASLGEARVLLDKGEVGQPAETAFRAALGLDAKHPKARFYLGLAEAQAGNRDEALKTWRALLADTPAQASWRAMLVQKIARTEGAAPELGQEQIAAGEAMSEADRSAMIAAMVDRLEARLKSESGDLDGWQRLINARLALGEKDRARASLAEANQKLKDRPEALAALAQFAKEMGLE